MLTEEIIDLIVKKRLGTLNSDEGVKLERWIKDDNAEEFIRTVNTLKTALELYEIYKHYNHDEFKDKQMAIRQKHSKGYNFRKLLKYAAIIALPVLFGAGIFYVYDNPYFQKTIPPGKEIAVIDLPNGGSVLLSSNIAKIYKSNGKEVIIPKIKVIDYLSLSGDFDEVNYSTIKVPHGGFYYIVLSDGTVVWLNSNSKMRFPLKFEGKERKVWVEGEAYFDVTKDTIPFIVSTESQDIRVLGTTFNVTAYPDEQITTTALISGSIVLQAVGSQESVVLQAGQCSMISKADKKVNVFEDDVQLYSLWKMGVFKFRECRLEDIVTVLKRWYDFDVEYESQSVKDIKFTTIALKNNPLDEVFRLLQMTTSISYKRRGNTIYLSD